MINNETEIDFTDEWSNVSMCTEDAKRVLQGGLRVLPQTHEEASACVYKSGFFMTTNKIAYFGEGPDAEGISTRLAVFDTQPFPQLRRSCIRWMCKNCRLVFHYCAEKLKNEFLFSDNDDDSDFDGNNSDEGSKYNEYDNANENLFNVHKISGFNFSHESFQREIANTIE